MGSATVIRDPKPTPTEAKTSRQETLAKLEAVCRWKYSRESENRLPSSSSMVSAYVPSSSLESCGEGVEIFGKKMRQPQNEE